MSNTNVVRYTIIEKTKLIICDDGMYKADKLFASPVKEEKWINKLAKKGYGLVDRTLGGYYFSASPAAEKYYYTVAYSPVSSSRGTVSEETVRITDEMGADTVLLFTYGTKVYYKTAHIPLSGTRKRDGEWSVCDAVLRCAADKRRRMRSYFLGCFGVLAFFLALLCYNLKYWVRFRIEDIGVKFVDGQLSDYIVKERSLWDYTFDLTELFGEYPCTPHISLFLCLTIFMVPFTVYYLDQYLYARSFEKAVKKQCVKE